MVEGLARMATRDRAGMRDVARARSYEYYVAAYRTLAVVVGLDVERLWRQLWSFPTGSVRTAFADVVGTSSAAAAGLVLSPVQRRRLEGMADRMFATARQGDLPVERAMLATWRVALG
jgi:hypothetical protein